MTRGRREPSWTGWLIALLICATVYGLSWDLAMLGGGR